MKKSSKLAFRGGSYSLLVTVLVLAILIVVNICVCALPTTVTKFDMSATKIYSLTSNTKAVLNSLEDDVTIYWIVQSGQEDKIVETMLDKYRSMSSHLNVIKRNPDVYPTFASQYTDEEVQNNSLVVERGDVFRYVPIYDIYQQSVNAATNMFENNFDGEAAITSAINYVTTDEHPCIYRLTGHGEAELPGVFDGMVHRANYDVKELSLVTDDAVPEDAACVVIYAPQSDISSMEKDMLTSYIAAGGKVLGFSGSVDKGMLNNLYSILSDYAVTMENGILLEEIPKYYTNSVFFVLPAMGESKITKALEEAEYKPVMAVSSGMTVGKTSRAEITQLLTSSSHSYVKTGLIAGSKLETIKTDEDVDGPFALAVDINDKTGGEIIWFSSSEFLVDVYNDYSSGANDELAMNALSALVGETEKLEIRSKSLSFNYLTINQNQGKFLKLMMIGVIPVLYLAIGISAVLETRRKQNEADE